MSLMDSLSGMMGGANPQLMGFVASVQSFIEQSGGIEGLKTKFEQQGAGSIVQSWVGTGANLPISADQIQKVMGNEFIQDMAKKMGIDPVTAGQKVTEMLPKLVDSLTPDGKVPDSINPTQLMSAASSLFAKN